ncbi:MAG: acyl-CoA dehydrogenase family protein [Halobacteria archaeon]
MVDLAFPKELIGLQSMVRSLAQHKLRPIARYYDEHEHEIPWKLIIEAHRMLKAMGGLRGKEAEKSGAASVAGTRGASDGMNSFYAAVLAEEMTWGDAGLAVCLPGPQVGGAAVQAAGTPEQKRRLLGRFPGDKPTWGAFALTEPGCGSDNSAIRTTARRDGDFWVLNGEKIFCTSGNLALDHSNGFVVVWATLDPELGRAGIKPFIVEAGTPGCRISKIEKKMGLRASPTCSLTLDECRIPLENLLGGAATAGAAISDRKPSGEFPEEPKTTGFKGVMATFDLTRPLVAAFALGVARAALDFTRDLLKQHGIQVRYGASGSNLTALERDFQQMEVQLHAARLLAWRAAWMGDRKVPNALEAAMAKVKAGASVSFVTQKCAEIGGWHGLSYKHMLEKWFRDAKVNDIYEGTGQVNTLIIARRILGYTREQLK